MSDLPDGNPFSPFLAMTDVNQYVTFLQNFIFTSILQHLYAEQLTYAFNINVLNP